LRRLGPVVHGGVRMFDSARARELLCSYRDIMASAPPELCGGMALLTAPPGPFVPAALRGRPVVAMIVLWAGDPAQAEAEAGLPVLDALGPADVDRVGPMPYAELQQIMDAGAPAGHRDYFKGGFISEVSDAAIDAIVGLGADLRAALTQIICTPLGAGTAYAAVDVERTYAPATLARLRPVKDRCDPHNVFRINHNIPPTSAAAR